MRFDCILGDEFAFNNMASIDFIESVESEIGIMLPDDYRDFLQCSNGGEGFVGSHYIILWKIEELVEFNNEYEVNKYAPDFFLFASDGAGEAFAFKKNDKFIYIIPFIGMSCDSALIVSDSFSNFLKKLGNPNVELF